MNGPLTFPQPSASFRVLRSVASAIFQMLGEQCSLCKLTVGQRKRQSTGRWLIEFQSGGSKFHLSLYLRGEIYTFRYRRADDTITLGKCTARSTGARNQAEAIRIAKARIIENEASRPNELSSTSTMLELLTHDWDFEKSERISAAHIVNPNKPSRDHVDNQRGLLLRYLPKTQLAKLRLGELRPKHIEDFFIQLSKCKKKSKGNLAPQTLKNILSAVQTSIRWAQFREYIKPGNFKLGFQLSVERQRRETYSQELLKRLFQEDWPDPTSKIIFTLGVVTGTRLGEIQAIRTVDLDVSERLVHVRGSLDSKGARKPTKTGIERVVPVPKMIMGVLEEYTRGKSPDDLVFSHPNNSNRPIDAKAVRSALFEKLREFGVPATRIGNRRLDFHAARHTCVSSLKLYVDQWAVELMVGHSVGTDSVRRYTHMTSQLLDALREAQETLLHDLGAKASAPKAKKVVIPSERWADLEELVTKCEANGIIDLGRHLLDDFFVRSDEQNATALPTGIKINITIPGPKSDIVRIMRLFLKYSSLNDIRALASYFIMNGRAIDQYSIKEADRKAKPCFRSAKLNSLFPS